MKLLLENNFDIYKNKNTNSTCRICWNSSVKKSPYQYSCISSFASRTSPKTHSNSRWIRIISSIEFLSLLNTTRRSILQVGILFKNNYFVFTISKDCIHLEITHFGCLHMIAIFRERGSWNRQENCLGSVCTYVPPERHFTR